MFICIFTILPRCAQEKRRQLRKWPQLGAQGDFERWERMSRVNKPGKMVAYFKANLSALVKKNLAP